MPVGKTISPSPDIKSAVVDTRPTPAAYGRSLTGLGFNLIVRDLDRAVAFVVQVLTADVVFRSETFAAVTLSDVPFMLHADQTYRNNPLKGSLVAAEARGVGVELRAYEVDPDAAEARARAGGWVVLAGTIDKPHGLRECMILDDDGYVWIPSSRLQDQP